ncbi:MAG: alpha/beta hydrolase [Kiloniellales bacterium]
MADGGVSPTDGYRERHLTAQDGLRLYYRDYGDALSDRRPLLCLAGLARNSKDFHSFALRQSHTRRVVCPDYRGRGRSGYDSDWRNYRPEVYVNDLLHLMAAANLHHVAICGISMGGLLAMGMAVAAPAQLAGVIVNDAGPEIETRGLARILEYVGRDHPQSDWDSALAETKRLFPQLGLDSEADWRPISEGTFREGEDGLLHVDWDVALAKALTHDQQDLWIYYRALAPLPVLAIRGELSDVLSAETFQRMAELKPDLVQVSVPGVGHVPRLNHPLVEHAIDDFLARLDA